MSADPFWGREPMLASVSSSYPEGAIVAISQSLAQNGQLQRIYFPATPRSGPAAWLMKLAPDRVRSRGEILGVDADRIEPRAWSLELNRKLQSRFRGAAAGADAMYRLKRRFDRRVAGSLHDVHEAPDCLIGMYGSSADSFAVARNRGIKTVLNFVNSHPAVHNECLSRFAGLDRNHPEMIPAEIERVVERELELSDLVLVPSTFLERQLTARGVPSERIEIVPYGVDLDRFSARGRDPESRSPGRVRVLFVGQISHRKGIESILRAASELAAEGAQFTLVGPMVSPEVMVDMPENSRHISTVGHGGVSDLMQRSDVFIQPSLEDSYSLATVEAMASGLPVIVSSNVGAGELVEDGTHGYVIEPGSSDALIGAIRKFIQNPGLAESMGARARERVERGHSWADYGDRVRGHLASLAG